MFDVGFWELVVLFGLGLMVLGPERLPKVASQLGRWAGQARRMARNLTSQLQDEIEPVQSSLKTVDDALRKDFSKMRPEFGDEAERGSTSEAPPEFDPEAEATASDAAGQADKSPTAAPDKTS
jgi:sec-independent protein translocase protein TatB